VKNYNKAIINISFLLLSIVVSINAQSLTWLGIDGTAYDVSENGNVVVGRFSVAPNGSHAFRWSVSGGMQDLGTLLPEHTDCIPRAVSADGNVVVGVSFNQFDRQAFIWIPSGGMQGFLPNATSSQAYDVSGNGGVVVGEMNLSGSTRPFRWTANGGVEDLSPITGSGIATGVSDDGTVIVGVVSDSTGTRVFRLINNSLTIIENPSGFNYLYSIYPKVSGNGEVVLANYHTGSSGPYAFKWSADTGWQNLGWVGLAGEGVERANTSGSIMAGSRVLSVYGISTAFRWTSSNGIQNLNDIYSNLLTNNSRLDYAHSISSNGRFIVGSGVNGAINWYDVYIIDTQSNLHITEPTSISKFIAGETGLIKWTGGQSGESLKIEYSVNDGNTYSQISMVQANAGQYTWHVPPNTLTTKARIKITDVADLSITTESQKFKIKPYVLTRLDADSNYYEYRKNRDQWGFLNSRPDMWPQTWWQQFNYQGTDPFTNAQYSQTQVNKFVNTASSNHPDWVSWVGAFGENNCYKSVSNQIYNSSAILRWVNPMSWNGSCFGIAAANALEFRYKEQFHNKYPNFPQISPPIVVSSDNGVKRVVNELFTHQFGKPSTTNDIFSANKTPYQTLTELKQMLIEDDATIRTISIINQNPSILNPPGGHTILAYGLEHDTIQTNLYYVKVYDNSNPNSINPITIDILANNAQGTWSTPDWLGWGGNQGMYLEVPSINYLNNASLNKSQSIQSPFILSTSELEINTTPTASIQIIDDQNNITGYNNGNVFNDIPGALPRYIKNGSVGPPYGYHLQIGNYSVVLSDFTDGISNTFFFTGNKSIMYERFGAFTGERDNLHFDGGIFVNNPDPVYKEITLLSLYNEGTAEKLFTASGLQLLQDNSVKFENPDSNRIKIISYGVDNSYTIELNYATENRFDRFSYSGISLYPNETQIFVPDWTSLANSNLKVLIDWESDGTIDDSLELVNQVLPVELSSFTAKSNGNDIELNWRTETEVSNYGFNVERRINEGEWNSIGFVEGHGNSNSPKEYSYTDKELFAGGSKFQYRLKQIDNDGSFEYSDIVEVEMIPDQYGLSQNYPNPFNPSTTIQFSLPKQTQLKINLYNMLGEQVATIAEGMYESGYHKVTFNASTLPSGTYVYRLESSDFVQVKKMMLLK
jgi:probable HAF family extracellular repeat protein